MEDRLKEASYSGDVLELNKLLQEDRLLLHRSAELDHATDSPLHISAALGHADFTREILVHNPELARKLGTGGLSPLHLASANGNLQVVKELLLHELGSELCFLLDKKGFLPIHYAAIQGQIEVLKELADTNPNTIKVVTCGNESTLHLAVRSSCVEVVRLLLERMGDDDEFLNLKDSRGNTALHLAMASRQLHTVKLLLSKGRDVEYVNTENNNGLTPLDVLLETSMESGDLILGELIRTAGGKTKNELRSVTEPVVITNFQGITSSEQITSDRRNANSKSGSEDNDTPSPEVLMVVATLIATITFQAGLNPPGGFEQSDSNKGEVSPSYEGSKPGQAVLGYALTRFLIFDIVGLFASLSIILLFTCFIPREKKMFTRVLTWVMWLAVFSTALAFTAGTFQIFPDKTYPKVLYIGWDLVSGLFVLWISIRFIKRLLQTIKQRRIQGGSVLTKTICCIVIKRTISGLMAVGLVFSVFYVLYSI